MSQRKICVVTGTRAEYGLLFWLMKDMMVDPCVRLQLIVTGMHLSPEFGMTYKQIEKDGFLIDARVEMLLSSDTSSGITKSIGIGAIGFADAFERLQPDLLVVLGDRYEILAAAQAAMIARIPIAHLHGGEATEGLIDEAIRHSITKMSHLHFVAAEAYRKRVIQLGEEPERVWNFGAPGIDNISRIKLPNKAELEERLGFTFGKPTFLVTYHPVTLSKSGPVQAMEELFQALNYFEDAHILFTKSNADTNGRVINKMIDEYVLENSERATVHTSLGHRNYLASILHSDIVIGNSSSGLIEVPFFKKPTINLGIRQQGRLKADTVVDCPEKADQIIAAVRKVLSSKFQQQLIHVNSPYGTGKVAERILQVLKSVNLEGLLMKKFYDLEF